MRYLVAQNIEHLYKEHDKRQQYNRQQQHNELKVIKSINKKPTDYRAIVTKSDKGNP